MNRVIWSDHDCKVLACGCVMLTGGRGPRCEEGQRVLDARRAKLTVETMTAFREHFHPETLKEPRSYTIAELMQGKWLAGGPE